MRRWPERLSVDARRRALGARDHLAGDTVGVAGTCHHAQGRAGHADLSPTRRYMRLSPTATQDAIRLLDGRLPGAPRQTPELFCVRELLERATGIEPVPQT